VVDCPLSCPRMKALLISLLAFFAAITLQAAEPTRILIVAGPSNHPPGSHETEAGARLLAACLENMRNLPGVEAQVAYDWPQDAKLRASIACVVFIGDTFPLNRLPEPKRNLAQLSEMTARGCGVVCLHYATGLKAEDVGPNGEHPLLSWTGGYFAHRSCPHHQSIAKIYPDAVITPAAPEHPVSRGWSEFTLHDEPYINNYFGDDDNQLAPNVTALATSMLPPQDPKREVVAWCVEREDGGRGFSIVMPHFYKNWTQETLRRFILNGVVWTAGLEVPEAGVDTAAPDLPEFEPASVEFVPRKK